MCGMCSSGEEDCNHLFFACLYALCFGDTSIVCGMCSSGEEDCNHLFFECPFARAVWSHQALPSINTSSETAFWDSIRRGGHKNGRGGMHSSSPLGHVATSKQCVVHREELSKMWRAS